MKFVSAHFVLLALLDSITAASILGLDPVKDPEEYYACKAALTEYPDTFAGYRYGENGAIKTVRYNQCIPLTNKTGEKIPNAFFCKPAICRLYTDDYCKDPALATAEAGVDIPVGSVDFPNALGFANALAQAAACTENPLAISS